MSRFALLLLLCCAVAPAQISNDIGLTLDSGGLTVLFGQFCGPVPCAPFAGGTIAVGSTRVVSHGAAALTPFALAVSLPSTNCAQIPGIANMLQLDLGAQILATGVTGPPVPAAFCPRGVANVQLTVPPSIPPGIAFVLQSIGVTWSGSFAFGPAIAAVTV